MLYFYSFFVVLNSDFVSDVLSCCVRDLLRVPSICHVYCCMQPSIQAEILTIKNLSLIT